MYNIKLCKIIYGYTPNCLENQDSPVLLIEPRSYYIDLVKKQNNKNIILISKILVAKDTCREINIYYDENDVNDCNTKYYITNGNGVNYKRFRGFSIGIEDIILQYKIQNITSFTININIDNCNEILDSIVPYNHIFSKIIVAENVSYFNKDGPVLNKFYTEKSQLNSHYFIHKNLNIELPRIGMFLCDTKTISDLNIDKLEFFIHQYKINMLVNNEDCKNKILINYPQSIDVLNNSSNKDTAVSKIYYENVIQNLEQIFIRREGVCLDADALDIIIQFNQNYFSFKNTLQIMYPLKDNMIYVNKQYDVMYSTKNCMYMLYQILKSRYFTDFINSKNKSLLKIFSKRWFYEYISTIFAIEEFF